MVLSLGFPHYPILSNIIQYYPIFPEKHLWWIKTSNATLRTSPAMGRFRDFSSAIYKDSFSHRTCILRISFCSLYMSLSQTVWLGNNIQIYSKSDFNFLCNNLISELMLSLSNALKSWTESYSIWFPSNPFDVCIDMFRCLARPCAVEYGGMGHPSHLDFAEGPFRVSTSHRSAGLVSPLIFTILTAQGKLKPRWQAFKPLMIFDD